MNRRIPTGIVPLTRSQLIHAPWSGAGTGVVCSCLHLRYLSNDAVLLLALCLGSLLMVLAGWVTYRSDHATRHGLVTPFLMTLLLLAPLSAGGAVLTLSMNGALDWRGWAVVSVGGSLLLVFGIAAVHQWRLLQKQGLDGPWVREYVDPVSGRLRADALMSGSSGQKQWHPAWVAGLGCNIPLLYHSWGVSDAQAMPFVLLVLLGASVQLCARHLGPAAGKAWFLLAWERRAGRPLVHENWEGLQALRRSYWLSRWLMVKEVKELPPPAAQAPRPTRTQRRRAGRQA